LSIHNSIKERQSKPKKKDKVNRKRKTVANYKNFNFLKNISAIMSH
jgi:hypothetical protein